MVLKYAQAEKFYDAFAAKQDRQFYEDAAKELLIKHSEFGAARSIVEFGCGTGKFAARLLAEETESGCQYLGVDISEVMIEHCRSNLHAFSERANVYKSQGVPAIDLPDESVDRFVSLYVLDLLTETDATKLVDEAYRILEPGGYLCLASLTHGISLMSNIVDYVWRKLYSWNAEWVGGCRPIDLKTFLPGDQWKIKHDQRIVSFGIASEVLVAIRL